MSDHEEPVPFPGENQSEASASTASAPATTSVPTAPRSIKLFFGGGQSQSAPRANPFDLNPEASKRRRKNADGPTPPAPGPTAKQGRIVLKPPGESGWAVEAGDDQIGADTVIGPGTGGGKGRPKGRTKKKGGGEGEEEELREMDKRAKAQAGRSTKGKGKGKGKVQEEGAQRLDLRPGKGDDDDYDTDDPIDSITTKTKNRGPSSKKRGRPAKRKPEPSGSRKTTRSVSTTRNSPPIAYVRSSSPHEPNDIVVTGAVRRTKHPIFSRTNTTSTSTASLGQSQKEPIDVEANPTNAAAKPGPKKLVFASDAKPAHSFFSRIAETGSTRPTPEAAPAPTAAPSDQIPLAPVPTPTALAIPSALPDSHPPAIPISQPIAGPSKKAHSFFQTNGSASKSSTLKAGWGNGIKEGAEWLPPWPGAEWPVHEGSADTPAIPGAGVKKRPIPRAQVDEEDNAFWHSVLARAELSTVQQTTASKPGQRVRQSHVAKTGADRETLCERFRPRTASQVLGNSTEATYLRDWLSALSIGTQDGQVPKVIRRLPKKKRKLDDWIVDDIGLFGDPQEEPQEELELEAEPPNPNLDLDIEMGMGERPTSYAPLSNWLTNTILLSGPNGSGKSAAVYAAASELGWEIFEVYPGIGKRTGGNLMSLVGDVGRNHMVGRQKEKEVEQAITEPKPKTANGLNGFFQPKSKPAEAELDLAEVQDDAPPLGSQGEPIEIEDDHEKSLTTSPHLHQISLPSTPFREDAKFRQSLILIEEVDILFDEEATFWPAIISLIADSRRPVVLTCNERVMADSIPLQAILQFQPPSQEVAVPYLSSLCTQLDLDLGTNAEYTSSLYERSIVHRPRTIQAPGPPNGNEFLSYFDLRRAIMQLQLEMGQTQTTEVNPTTTVSVSHPSATQDLAAMIKRAEKLSYTDAYLDERSWAVMELNELDRYNPSSDDQLGVQALLKAELPDRIPTLPAYDRTREITSFLLAQYDHDPDARPSKQTEDLITDQLQYIRTLLPLLDPIIPLSSHLLPHPTLFTDYLPAIQHLVQIDDIRQSAYVAAKAAGEDLRNIKTGRPVRLTAWLNQEYERGLDLEEGALEVARQRLRYD